MSFCRAATSRFLFSFARISFAWLVLYFVSLVVRRLICRRRCRRLNTRSFFSVQAAKEPNHQGLVEPRPGSTSCRLFARFNQTRSTQALRVLCVCFDVFCCLIAASYVNAVPPARHPAVRCFFLHRIEGAQFLACHVGLGRLCRCRAIAPNQCMLILIFKLVALDI